MAVLAVFWPFLALIASTFFYLLLKIRFFHDLYAPTCYLGACFGIFQKFVFLNERRGVKHRGAGDFEKNVLVEFPVHVAFL